MTQPPTQPPTWPPAHPPAYPPAHPPAHPPVHTPAKPPTPSRPADVDTGFWLWLAALPLMTTGYVVTLLTTDEIERTAMFYPAIAVMAVVICAVVVTFLLLMRSGYRWARTVLTGGAMASVVYALSAVLDADPRPAVAVTSAVTGIVGSVLIGAGVLLLHRSDAQGFFTR